MSNKGYAVLLVLAGMVCGILVVSLTSSPATAKLPTMEPVIAQPPKVIASSTHPGNIRVYPVGMGGKSNRNEASAYVVKDGKLWHCEATTARPVHFTDL